MGVCCCKKKQEPIDFLKKSPLGQCTNQTLAKIVKYLDLETFSEGTELYSSNDTPDRKIYFIVDGNIFQKKFLLFSTAKRHFSKCKWIHPPPKGNIMRQTSDQKATSGTFSSVANT